LILAHLLCPAMMTLSKIDNALHLFTMVFIIR